jgi:hypothetical protein
MTPVQAEAVSGGVTINVTATGAHSIPSSKVPYQLAARFSFDEPTRRLGYEIRLTRTREDVAGVYLHRRAMRQNGGVAYVLAKATAPQISGTVNLTEAEASDLKAGTFYVAALSRVSPRLSARADLVFPIA